jgi:hypothetical protein
VSEDYIHLLEDEYVEKRMNEIKERICNLMKSMMKVEHKFCILTTKLITKSFVQEMGEWGSCIRIDKTSKYWPTRIQEYLSEHPTFLDHKKRERDGKVTKDQKKERNPSEEE